MCMYIKNLFNIPDLFDSLGYEIDGNVSEKWYNIKTYQAKVFQYLMKWIPWNQKSSTSVLNGENCDRSNYKIQINLKTIYNNCGNRVCFVIWYDFYSYLHLGLISHSHSLKRFSSSLFYFFICIAEFSWI